MTLTSSALSGTRRGAQSPDPNDLRELARRIRVIASTVGGAERDRLLDYADEVDGLALRGERRVH